VKHTQILGITRAARQAQTNPKPPLKIPACTSISNDDDENVSGIDTTNCEEAITTGRSIIDAIDTDIIRLVRQRQSVSHAIQQARVNAGQPRLNHAREHSIFRRYADNLGRPGNTLATAILDSCRDKGPWRP
jgi:chorismate mutase